jgi:hypothetical protein
MQAIGICRFSYPALGGFQVEHGSAEDRAAYLYAPARLDERFALFETVALPCLRAQTDQNFEVVVVIGEDFPTQYRARLEGLIADVPQLRIEAHAPGPHRQVMRHILNSARHDPDAPCLQFRFDDDDAIGVDFIEQFRQAAEDCSALTDKQRAVAFDWHQGYVAEFGAGGVEATPTFRRLFTAALGIYVRGGAKLSIMNFAHNKIDQHMPVVSFGDRPMWVRSHNGFNDSRQKKNAHQIAVAPLDEDDSALFQELFAIDPDAVRAAFSAL